MSDSIITNPLDCGLEVERIRSSVPKGGAYAGWEQLDRIYTAKKGFPLVIYGAPHSGKSVFMLNLLVNLSRQHGWKHLVFSSEQGSVADLILEVAEIYLRKPLRKYTERGVERMNVATEAEHIMAQQWVAKYFRFIDPTHPRCQRFSLHDFYSWCDEAAAEGFEADVTVLDPFNDVDMNLKKHGGRQDLWLTEILKDARDEAMKKNRLDILVNHISQQQTTMVSERGQRFAPPAMMNEANGGVAWSRRAFTVLLVYRPPSNDQLKFGKHVVHTGPAESWIICQKAKPKGAAELGQAILFYDKDSGCFYERRDPTALEERFFANELQNPIK
jgi:hypothetical protein